MITPEQESWLKALPTDKYVKIIPYDKTSKEKYEKAKKYIQSLLGLEIPVIHRGSSSLEISGQDEIDVYIPVEPEDFELFIVKLKSFFGDPKTVFPMQRARFSFTIEDKDIDLFLSNVKHKDWVDGNLFEEICRKRPEILVAYEELKKNMNGWTVRDFYWEKTKFVDSVLSGEL